MRHDWLDPLLQLIILLALQGIGSRTHAIRHDTLRTLLPLLDVVIPLTFLGIWSWTTLSNRKGQLSRSRVTGGPGRIGRPGWTDEMWDRELDAGV